MGNVPVKLFDSSKMYATVVLLGMQVIPNQLHSVPGGPFQPVEFVQFAPLVLV